MRSKVSKSVFTARKNWLFILIALKNGTILIYNRYKLAESVKKKANTIIFML